MDAINFIINGQFVDCPKGLSTERITNKIMETSLSDSLKESFDFPYPELVFVRTVVSIDVFFKPQNPFFKILYPHGVVLYFRVDFRAKLYGHIGKLSSYGCHNNEKQNFSPMFNHVSWPKSSLPLIFAQAIHNLGKFVYSVLMVQKNLVKWIF